MELDAAMDEALARRPEASALACVDAASGMVLASAARSEDARLALSSAAAVSTVLSASPRIEEPGDCTEDAPVDRLLIVTRRWVQVHERVPGRPALFVVGVADAGSNIGLLASCVRDVSSLLGASLLEATG